MGDNHECDHQPVIDLLTQLEESEQYAALAKSAVQTYNDLERRGDLPSLRAASQIRSMAMKAFAVMGQPEETLMLFEDTRDTYGSHSDKEILFWVHSTAIACADTYWEAGRRAEAYAILESCVERFTTDSHPGLRTLALRAAIDLSICKHEEGDAEGALKELNRALATALSDTSLSVQEEFCRAAQERYRCLCIAEDS